MNDLIVYDAEYNQIFILRIFEDISVEFEVEETQIVYTGNNALVMLDNLGKAFRTNAIKVIGVL